MVAKIVTGKSIKGAMNYNEKKVQKGEAKLLRAAGFPSDSLSFKAKLHWFRNLTELNKRTKTNTVHISLNFDPSEHIEVETLKKIAETYMQGIGFSGQPYLLYQHNDANHPHVHIVTTNIKSDGSRILLHYIGAGPSEKARKDIEKTFGLIPAEGREKAQETELKTLSSMVTSAIREYKFTSLAELNAVLNEKGITAYRGEPGSKMYQKNGLAYCALEESGERKGALVKASALYGRPTLNNLQKRFEKNKAARLIYKTGLKEAIEDVLLSGFIRDKDALRETLGKRNISILYRENDTMVFGITFIDHNNKVVFNGSDLGKSYSAKNILSRIGAGGLAAMHERENNRAFMADLLENTDFTVGVPEAIAGWYDKGMRIKTNVDSNGNVHYGFGHLSVHEYNYQDASMKFNAWLINNGISPFIVNRLNEAAEKYANQAQAESTGRQLLQYLNHLLASVPETPSATNSYIPKRKKKRKPNW